jgi:hypothetical protein
VSVVKKRRTRQGAGSASLSANMRLVWTLLSNLGDVALDVCWRHNLDLDLDLEIDLHHFIDQISARDACPVLYSVSCPACLTI